MAESPSAAGAAPRLKVGYALAPKKVTSFIQPSLLHHAARRGIDLVPVDPTEPLLAQGPFDCLIHKLHGDDWRNQLLQFSLANPTVPIVDHPHAIERLHSRVTMLQLVPQLDLHMVDIPKQIVLRDSHYSFRPFNDLHFPVIAKPLAAYGSAESHDMLLIFNQQGFTKLKPPVVLQEFVNHGGVIFKIYVVGQHVECVARNSLPDISEEKMKTSGDSLSFSQISNSTAIHHTSNDDFLEATDLGSAHMPPLGFVTDLALRLRQALGLNLFNFDLIKERDRYLVIDINYFPGYAKMPNYETVLSEFFWEVVHKNPNIVLQKTSP